MMNAKIGYDGNGNKVCRVVPCKGGRGFSIQTNGNLPMTDRSGVGEWTPGEVAAYVERYGTKRQQGVVIAGGWHRWKRWDNPA